MAKKPETCVWCGGADVVPRGKITYKGRKVTEVECKKCGITFVSKKDLPIIDPMGCYKKKMIEVIESAITRGL